MSKQAKAMQKLIRNREGNDAYDSDDEKNPYASSVGIWNNRDILLLTVQLLGGRGRRTCSALYRNVSDSRATAKD